MKNLIPFLTLIVVSFAFAGDVPNLGKAMKSQPAKVDKTEQIIKASSTEAGKAKAKKTDKNKEEAERTPANSETGVPGANPLYAEPGEVPGRGMHVEGAQEITDEPYIASIDVYGSRKLSEKVIRKTLGKKFDWWLKKGMQGSKKAADLERDIIDTLKKKFNLALAEFTILNYFQPGDLAIRMTLDVVEKRDATWRMPFQAAPTKELKDPTKLIEKWYEYEALALELFDSAQLQPKDIKCKKAWHCPFGHKHKKLVRYEDFFHLAVKKEEKKLIAIAKGDKRPTHRGAALFLLAYMEDGNKLVKIMVKRVTDADPMVRDNALRVLGDIAEFHTEIPVPAQPLIQALEFPRVMDRSKAAYALMGLAMHSSQARKKILAKAVPSLLKYLESKQPNHRDVAHTILRKVSGKDFAIEKVATWKAWYQRLPAQAIAKKEKKKPLPK